MSSRLRVVLLVLAVALPLMPFSYALAADPAVENITNDLMCQCGCGMTIAVCRSSMECLFSQQATDITAQQLAAGRSKAEILNYFVSIYGEKIRTAPTKSGFNITAWVTPFVGVAIGLAIVWRFALLTRRRVPAVVPVSGSDEQPEPVDDKLLRYEQLVDQDLKRFE